MREFSVAPLGMASNKIRLKVEKTYAGTGIWRLGGRHPDKLIPAKMADIEQLGSFKLGCQSIFMLHLHTGKKSPVDALLSRVVRCHEVQGRNDLRCRIFQPQVSAGKEGRHDRWLCLSWPFRFFVLPRPFAIFHRFLDLHHFQALTSSCSSHFVLPPPGFPQRCVDITTHNNRTINPSVGLQFGGYFWH